MQSSCTDGKGGRVLCPSQRVPQKICRNWELSLGKRTMDLIAGWDGRGAECRAVIHRSITFGPIPGQMQSGQCCCVGFFPYTLKCPRWLLLSSSGSRGTTSARDFWTLCYQIWSHEYLFFPFFQYNLARYIAQALSHDRCKITVRMWRREGDRIRRQNTRHDGT